MLPKTGMESRICHHGQKKFLHLHHHLNTMSVCRWIHITQTTETFCKMNPGDHLVLLNKPWIYRVDTKRGTVERLCLIERKKVKPKFWVKVEDSFLVDGKHILNGSKCYRIWVKDRRSLDQVLLGNSLCAELWAWIGYAAISEVELDWEKPSFVWEKRTKRKKRPRISLITCKARKLFPCLSEWMASWQPYPLFLSQEVKLSAPRALASSNQICLLTKVCYLKGIRADPLSIDFQIVTMPQVKFLWLVKREVWELVYATRSWALNSFLKQIRISKLCRDQNQTAFSRILPNYVTL